MKIRYAKYKTYSGLVVSDVDYPVEQGDFKLQKHMHRAAWLATMLEGPYWGTVQSYDGAGLSAGPFHFIGRHRDGTQGPLFQLMRHMEIAGATTQELWTLFVDADWYIGQDGKLRSFDTGVEISGNDFRNVVAPPNGKVPVKGPNRDQAEAWAIAFHRFFREGIAAQVDFSVSYLVRNQRALELEAYKLYHDADLENPEPLLSVNMDAELDLAMAVYHSHSVNAPGAAASCLQEVLRPAVRVDTFPQELVRELATKKYGAWDKRYQRTRKAAMESALWDEKLFAKDGVMPASFG